MKADFKKWLKETKRTEFYKDKGHVYTEPIINQFAEEYAKQYIEDAFNAGRDTVIEKCVDIEYRYPDFEWYNNPELKQSCDQKFKDNVFDELDNEFRMMISHIMLGVDALDEMPKSDFEYMMKKCVEIAQDYAKQEVKAIHEAIEKESEKIQDMDDFTQEFKNGYRSAALDLGIDIKEKFKKQ